MSEGSRPSSLSAFRRAAENGGYESVMDFFTEAGAQLTAHQINAIKDNMFEGDGSLNSRFKLRELWQDTVGQSAQQAQQKLSLFSLFTNPVDFLSQAQGFIAKLFDGLGKLPGNVGSGLTTMLKSTLGAIGSKFGFDFFQDSAAEGDASQSQDIAGAENTYLYTDQEMSSRPASQAGGLNSVASVTPAFTASSTTTQTAAPEPEQPAPASTPGATTP